MSRPLLPYELVPQINVTITNHNEWHRAVADLLARCGRYRDALEEIHAERWLSHPDQPGYVEIAEAALVSHGPAYDAHAQTYRTALQEIRAVPIPSLNPDGLDQAAHTMRLIASEALSSSHQENRPGGSDA